MNRVMPTRRADIALSSTGTATTRLATGGQSPMRRPSTRQPDPVGAIRWFALIAALVATLCTTHSRTLRAEEPPLAAGGLDPVLLAEGQETPGDPLLSVQHEGLVYRFDSDRTRRAFAAEPDRYAVQLGGACARMGPGVEGDPELFTVHDGKLYLFGTEQCLERFEEEPDRYVLPQLAAIEASRGEMRAARELLAKAAGSLSKKPLHRLPGYRAVGAVERGPRSFAFELRLSADGAVWRKQMAGDDVRVETWSGGAGAVDGRRGRAPLSPQAQLALLEEARRFDALTLLHTLDLGELTAAIEEPSEPSEPSEPGPTRLVRFAVPQQAGVGGGEQLVLEIDRHSGRVTSLRFRGRGPGGRAGWITRRFDDFRATGGLFVPFRREDTFEGQSEPFQITLLERVEIAELERELLETAADAER